MDKIIIYQFIKDILIRIKSDKLYDQSKNINSLANTIKNQKKAEKLRNMRLLIGGGIILVILIFIILL